MMDLSFHWPYPRLKTPLGDVSVRLHTFENIYAMHPDHLVVTEVDGARLIESTRLAWAGGQRTTDGQISVRIAATDGIVKISAAGEHLDGVRSVVVTLHNIARGDVTHVREGRLVVPDTGRLVSYPHGWWDLATPHLVIEQPTLPAISIRSLDNQPRPKTFALIPHFHNVDLMDVELHLEADATDPSARLATPPWVIQRTTDLDQIRIEHREHIAQTFACATWETRDDVPAWTRDVGLVLTLHGQHFTGRTFLDYSAALDTIKQVAEWIDPHRILAYLPGWEGRYYRWYGRYDADDSMGGAAGFERLVQGAQSLGAHVMPMFGANIASRDIPGYERWGEPGRQLLASGLAPVGSVDWDASRHFDHGFGAVINTAYRPWRRHLVTQIAYLHDRFGFDASFLDISAMYANDPRGRTTDGIRSLVTELHEQVPDHLIAGEGWFDAIADVVPLVQAGHRANIPAYHDIPDEDLFCRTNRAFAHVNLGDPAHGSSGVHEAGYVTAWRTPLRRAVIPTLSLVEDTLTAAPDRVRAILDDAHEYVRQFL